MMNEVNFSEVKVIWYKLVFRFFKMVLMVFFVLYFMLLVVVNNMLGLGVKVMSIIVLMKDSYIDKFMIFGF